MRDKVNKNLIDYQIVSASLDEGIEFEHLLYYKRPFTCIDCRFINFLSSPENVDRAVELSMYKLMQLNPSSTMDDLLELILFKLKKHSSSSLINSVLESDVKKACIRAWNNPNYDLSRRIYSTGHIIWKRGAKNAFRLTEEEKRSVQSRVETKTFITNHGNPKKLSKKQTDKVTQAISQSIINGKMGAYASKCRSKVENSNKYSLIIAAIEQLMEDNQFVSIENISLYSGYNYDVVRKAMSVLEEASEVAKRYNLESYGFEDGRRLRKHKNIDDIANYIIETGNTNKTDIARCLGISKQTVYNLWDEVKKVIE